MKIGTQLKLKLGEQINENTYNVICLKSNIAGVLKVKGRLRTYGDGTTNGWVMEYNPKVPRFMCGNSYFGKYSISENISRKYVKILTTLFESPELIKDEDISYLKGMCNRCIKKDQWDWYTTFQYLGYPSFKILRNYVDDSKIIRDEIRTKNYQNLESFKEKYSYLLNSMLFHLRAQSNQGDDLTNKSPITQLNETYWQKLSPDSQENIRLLKQISNTNSAYFLMHFFVTLEQEFFNNFVSPFIDYQRNTLQIPAIYHGSYFRTHNILTGDSHFSLGSIFFLGNSVTNNGALNQSQAIREFSNFLGSRKSIFQNLCNEISSASIKGLSLSKLRNGIAHGNPETLAEIDQEIYNNLFNILFLSPSHLIIKILDNSLKN